MRGRKVVPRVILILFLISVAVLEVILRHEDRGEQGDSTHGRESAESSTSSLELERQPEVLGSGGSA